MRGREPFRLWLLALALCTLSVLLCIGYVDRPVADFVQAEMRPTTLYHLIHATLGALRVVPVLMLGFLLGAGSWAIAGRQLTPWTRTPLLCSWSTAWAFSAATILKRIVGRADVDPTYLQTGGHGFHPLLGGHGYEAFPSSTMAVATAVLAVLWIRVPRLRAATAVVGAALAIAIVLTNGHWVGDIIAGSFLGATIGCMTALLI